MLKRPVLYFVLLLAILSNPSIAFENPSGWPWRGINIDGIDFSKDDFKRLVAVVDVNSVQLRLSPRKIAKKYNYTPEIAWQKSLSWGDMMLDICNEYNIKAIMTVEGFPIDPSVDYNQTSPKFWFNRGDLSEVVRLASELSMRFKNRGSELVAYQLLSEPVIKMPNSTIAPPQLNKLLENIIVAIRKNDKDRWITVSPAPWGLPNGYSDFDIFPFEKIIYSAHMYLPHNYTHQGIRQHKNTVLVYPGKINGAVWDKRRLKSSMEDLRRFQLKHDVPIWIGEFSAIRWANGGEQYIQDLVAIFDEYQWSWTYFSLTGWHGWNPDYNHVYPSDMDWKSNYAGSSSVRWKTLKKLFNTKPVIHNNN